MKIADLSNKRVLICYIEKALTELVAGKPWRKNLLDCVSKYWEIPDIIMANSADFVIGVNAAKEIMIVAKPDKKGWQKVKEIAEIRDEEPAKKFSERYAFEGADISKTSEALQYIGKTIPVEIEFWHGISCPLYYFNGQIISLKKA